MRLTATSITIFALLMAGCTPQPTDMKQELGKLNGPKPDTMDDSLKGQADQAVASKDYARAAQTYKQLSDKSPDNREYTLALADSLRRSNDNQGAMRVLDKYLATNPQDATALETKGLCLMTLGSFTDAGKSFEAVMKTEPNRWRTLNAIGILFTMKNKLPEAIQYYDEALRNSPDNASVLNNKAITLAMDNKYDLSIDTFMRTRKNIRVGTSDMQQIDMNLSLVYAIAGKLDEAERTASPYLSKPALYNNMGVYAELAKNPELARSYLNMALTQSPVYYERAWSNLGTVTNDNTTVDGKAGSLTQVDGSSDVKTNTQKPLRKKRVKKVDVEAAGSTKLDQIPTPDMGATAPPINAVTTPAQ